MPWLPKKATTCCRPTWTPICLASSISRYQARTCSRSLALPATNNQAYCCSRSLARAASPKRFNSSKSLCIRCRWRFVMSCPKAWPISISVPARVRAARPITSPTRNTTSNNDMTTNINTRLYLRKSLLSLICARPDFRGSHTAGYLSSAAQSADDMSYGPDGKMRISPVGRPRRPASRRPSMGLAAAPVTRNRPPQARNDR